VPYLNYCEDEVAAWHRCAACNPHVVKEVDGLVNARPTWALFTVCMTTVGLAHLAARRDLSVEKKHQWRLRRDLVPKCVDEKGQLLYTCEMNLVHRAMQAVLLGCAGGM
jgi:hypothetical protein